MQPARTVQTSFTAGEVDPRLKSRIEVTRYYSGAALLRNLLVQPQGGIRRRPGTRHLSNLGGQPSCRLIPFAFNTEQTYAIALIGGGFVVWLADGSVAASVISCPWSATQAAQMNYAQSADTLLLFHPDLPPQRIRRGGSHTVWSRDDVPLSNIPTHDYGAVTPSGNMTPSATTGTITLTCTGTVFTAAVLGWECVMNSGRALITGIVSTTVVNAIVRAAFANTDPIAATGWSINEPVISGARGWPECGTFHDGRLWLAGFRSRPATLIASRIGDYFDFLPGTGQDDEGINVTIDSDQVNAIHAIRSGRNLMAFTSGAEFAVTVTPPITPGNIALEEQSRRGIKRFGTLAEVDGATLFVQRGGAALRQLVYQDVEQAWRAELVSLLAPHLIKDPVQLSARKTAQSDDADLVFIVNADGTMTVLTTLRAQEIQAFSRWETDGEILSACALASGEVFLAVRRNTTVRVERVETQHLLDAGTRQVVPGGTSLLTGLAHLDGYAVALYLDGAYLGEATVTSGQVVLPRPAVTVEVGLNLDVRARMLPFEPRAPTGALIGQKARIVSITARVHETGPFLVQGRPVLHRQLGIGADTPLDTASPVVTTDISLRGLTGWSRRIEVEVSQPEPGPFQLLALAYSAVVQT